MARATARGSPPTRVTSAASMATSAPVPIAMPRSAAASAGASLMPSPTIATMRPSACSRSTSAALSAGRTSARTRSAGCRPARRPPAAVAPPSPVTSQTSMPWRCSSRDRPAARRLDRVGDRDEAEQPRPSSGHARRRPAPAAATAAASARARRGRCRARVRQAGSPDERSRGPVDRRRRPRRAADRARSPRPAGSRARPSRARARIAAPSGCSLPFSTRARQVEQLVAASRPGPRRSSPTDGRPSGQRAGLVEHDRVDPVGGLERLAAADEDARPPRRGRSRP